MTDVAQIVKEVIVERLKVDPAKVTENANFIDDLGADSLDQVDLIMELEDRFHCSIPDEVSSTLTTVGEAITFIQNNGEF